MTSFDAFLIAGLYFHAKGHMQQWLLCVAVCFADLVIRLWRAA